MEKQMYLETRGSTVYLVIRANKQLNTAERRNLKQWGFIIQDSARRVYALGFNRDASAADPIITSLRRYGFVLTDNTPVCALTADGRPRELVAPADKYLVRSESGYKALVAAGIIPASVPSFRRVASAKIAPAMADEESHRYNRMMSAAVRMCY